MDARSSARIGCSRAPQSLLCRKGAATPLIRVSRLCLVLAIACSAAAAQQPPGSSSPAAQAQPLSLQEALRLALRNHTSISIAQQNVTSVRARLTEAAATLAPQVTAAANASWSGVQRGFGGGGGPGAPVSSTSTSHGALISIKQLICDSMQTPARIHQARAGLQSARYGATAVEQALLLQVTTDYYSVLSAKSQLAVAQANLQGAKEEEQMVAARVEEGEAARKDLLAAQAARAQAEVDVIAAGNAVQQALAVLRNSMGIPQTSPLEPSDQLTVPPFDIALEDATRQALSQRPEVLRGQADLEQARLTWRLAKIQSGPVLGVTGSYDVQVDPSPVSRGFSVNAGLSFPVFDASLTRARVVEARTAYETARLQLEQTRRDVELQVKQAWLAASEARARIDAAERAVASAQENLDAATGSFEASASILLEVTQARAALLRAQSARVIALRDYNVALAQLRYAMGRMQP